MPKEDKNSLAQLQAYFTKQLTLSHAERAASQESAVSQKSTADKKPPAESNPLPSLLVASNFTPEQLINIYRNNFVMSLRELLEQLFPVTQALVGTAYFTQTSQQFIQHCPLEEPHLNHYGGHFVSFIEELKALEHMPFVAQMAQLEWHLDRISHIYYQPNFNFDKLAQIGEEQYLNIHFNLSETCHLQTSSMDLIALHKDVSAASKTSPDTNQTNYQKLSYILVLQNQQGESALMPLNHQHWVWLSGLQNGFTLAQLCGIENTEITSLMAQITDWIALGCIDGFNLTADSQP
jgi:hypothetical protein